MSCVARNSATYIKISEYLHIGNMSKYIAIANLKGGTGKTTIAVMLSYSLAKLGHRVILIDFDPQASATAIFFRGLKFEKHLGTYIGISARRQFHPYPPEDEDIFQRKGVGNLKIFPSTTSVFTDAWSIAYSYPDPETVASWLRGEPVLRRSFDYVVIDCPPDPNFARIGVKASDVLIIPSDDTALSLHGTKEFISKIFIHEVLVKKHEIKLLGIVFNKIRFIKKSPTKSFQKIKNELRSYVYNLVSERTEIKDFIYNDPIFNTVIPFRKTHLNDIVLFNKDKRSKCKIPKIYDLMEDVFRNLAIEVINRINYFKGVKI